MDTRQQLKCNNCKKIYTSGCIYPPSKSKCKHCGHKGATKIVSDQPTEGNEN